MILRNNERIEMQELLTLIENVDPTDSAALDEIDARVMAYVLNKAVVKHVFEDDAFCYSIKGHTGVIHKYTRDRNALKEIRPEEWMPTILGGWTGADCTHVWFCKMYSGGAGSLKSPDLPTEELAELHTIIQAITYEREQAGD